jgi:hypothetical protein
MAGRVGASLTTVATSLTTVPEDSEEETRSPPMRALPSSTPKSARIPPIGSVDDSPISCKGSRMQVPSFLSGNKGLGSPFVGQRTGSSGFGSPLPPSYLLQGTGLPKSQTPHPPKTGSRSLEPPSFLQV